MNLEASAPQRPFNISSNLHRDEHDTMALPRWRLTDRFALDNARYQAILWPRRSPSPMVPRLLDSCATANNAYKSILISA